MPYQFLGNTAGKLVYVPCLGTTFIYTVVSVEKFTTLGIEVTQLNLARSTRNECGDLKVHHNEVLVNSISPVDVIVVEHDYTPPTSKTTDYARMLNLEVDQVYFCAAMRRWVKPTDVQSVHLDKEGNLSHSAITPWVVLTESGWLPISFDEEISTDIILAPIRCVDNGSNIINVSNHTSVFTHECDGTIVLRDKSDNLLPVPGEVFYGK